MRYAFIRNNEQRHPVSVLCRVFKVSMSGYFGWKARPESKRTIENRRLLKEIKDIHNGVIKEIATFNKGDSLIIAIASKVRSTDPL